MMKSKGNCKHRENQTSNCREYGTNCNNITNCVAFEKMKYLVKIKSTNQYIAIEDRKVKLTYVIAKAAHLTDAQIDLAINEFGREKLTITNTYDLSRIRQQRAI